MMLRQGEPNARLLFGACGVVWWSCQILHGVVLDVVVGA
jgi:hypothetical protein